MKENPGLVRKNNDLAQTTWGELSATLLQGLEELTDKYGLSVALGDLQQIDGRWYVTHAACFALLNAGDATVSGLPFKRTYPTQSPTVGCSRRRSTKLQAPEVSSATGMPTPPMFPLSFGAPRCAWPRPERSTGPFGRLMALDSVLSKSWDRSPVHQGPSPHRRVRMALTVQTVRTTATLASGTSSAF